MSKIDNSASSEPTPTMRMRCALTAASAVLVLSVSARAADPKPPASTSASTGMSDDRIICRKTAEVGSLVRRKKQCFTKAEWDKLAEAHQRGARKLMDGLTERYSCQSSSDPNSPGC